MMTYNEQRSGQKTSTVHGFITPPTLANNSLSKYEFRLLSKLIQSSNASFLKPTFMVTKLSYATSAATSSATVAPVCYWRCFSGPCSTISSDDPSLNTCPSKTHSTSNRRLQTFLEQTRLLAGPLHSGQNATNLAQPGQVPNTSFHQAETGGAAFSN